MFANPVDPERDRVPNYLQVISHPMDFGTIKKKLFENSYQSVEQWKADVELVFENTYKFHGQKAMISYLAHQLQAEFHKYSRFVSANVSADWATRLEELNNEYARLVKLGPKPYGPPKQTKKQSNKLSRAQSLSTREYNRTPTFAQSTPAPSPPPVKTPPRPTKTAEVPLTDEEIMVLTDTVNRLENPDHISAVSDLIREHEPHLITGDEDEIEVARLQTGTLKALKKLLDELDL